MKGKTNPIFEKNYGNYLRKVNDVDLSQCASVLRITVDEEKRTAEIPFFKTIYRVSQSGVVDDRGKRPDYGTCVVLLKYLLMCPQHVTPETDWVTYRDFSDSGQTQDAGRIQKDQIGVGKDQQIAPDTTEAMCNPVLQAMILNNEKTDFYKRMT